MPTRTAFTCSIATIAALAAVACATPAPGTDPPAPGDPPPAVSTPSESVMMDDLRVSARVETAPVRAGAAITFGITVSNDGAAPITIDFSDGQRFDFEVFDGSRLVWRWSADMAFIQMIGQETIRPGTPLSWTAELTDGLPTGTYRLVATVTAMEPASVELSFDVTG